MWFTSVDLKDAYFSRPHRPTSQKVPSVHFSKQNLAVQSPSVWPVSFSQGVHMRHSSGIGATSTRRHADSSVPGRLAVVRQIIPTGCRQHTAFVQYNSDIKKKKHQGGTMSLICLQLTRRLLCWAYRHFPSVRANHIPGCCNGVADSLSSSGLRPGEWCLHKEVVQTIWIIMGQQS